MDGVSEWSPVQGGPGALSVGQSQKWLCLERCSLSGVQDPDGVPQGLQQQTKTPTVALSHAAATTAAAIQLCLPCAPTQDWATEVGQHEQSEHIHFVTVKSSLLSSKAENNRLSWPEYMNVAELNVLGQENSGHK